MVPFVLASCYIIQGLLLVPVFKAQGMAAGSSTQNRLLTYFSDRPLTWNQAVELCESIDSNLVTLDSEDTYNAIKTFSTEAWGGSWTDFWTGLHNVVGDYVDPPVFLWQASCTEQGDYQPWDEMEAVNLQRCVEGDSHLVSGRILEASLCSSLGNKALCEKVQGSCRFNKLEDQIVEPAQNVTVFKQTTLMACYAACLDHIGPLECWALEFDSAKTCTLHHDVSETAMRSRIRSDIIFGTTVYLKFCFSAAINKTDITLRSVYNAQLRPVKGCELPQESETTIPVGPVTSPDVTTNFKTTFGLLTSTDSTDQDTDPTEYTALESTTTPRAHSSLNASFATTIELVSPPGPMMPPEEQTSSELNPSVTSQINMSTLLTPESQIAMTSQLAPSTTSQLRFDTTPYLQPELSIQTELPGTTVLPSPMGSDMEIHTTSGITPQAMSQELSTFADHSVIQTTVEMVLSALPIYTTQTFHPTIEQPSSFDPGLSSTAPQMAIASTMYELPLSTTEGKGLLTSDYKGISMSTVVSEGNSVTLTAESSSGATYITNVFLESTSPNGSCQCQQQQPASLTPEQKQTFIDDLLAGLSLNMTQVSANQRRYYSATDSRVSAKAMGYLGIVIMVLVFSFIIIVDINAIFRDFRYFVWKQERSALKVTYS